jgi:hypothetical protein
MALVGLRRAPGIGALLFLQESCIEQKPAKRLFKKSQAERPGLKDN